MVPDTLIPPSYYDPGPVSRPTFKDEKCLSKLLKIQDHFQARRKLTTKKYKLQEQQKSFVLVQFSALDSLENNVNKQTSAAPVIYTF